ncbi:MAG: hypothetical protein D6731_20685 [Planctomycetota bacterium]|nr:MAG: hypothetical protein D6731_20685 [Planctomycetota bacterium]
MDDVGHPADQVFHLIRDRQPELVPYLSDVESIEVLEREDLDDGQVRIVNMWRGSARSAPAVVQKFLSPDLLSWKDHATWYPEGPPRAEWRLEPKIGSSLFECTGRTAIVAADEGCRIEISGDLSVYPEKVPGVPRLLAGRLRSKIEAFVVDMIVPNLQTMARGVQNFLDDQSDAASGSASE